MHILLGRRTSEDDPFSAFFIYASFKDLISSYKTKTEIKGQLIFDQWLLVLIKYAI